MNLNNYCFKPFTVSVVVHGVAYVATEVDQRLLHDRVAIAIELAVGELSKDPSLTTSRPKTTTTWPDKGVLP